MPPVAFGRSASALDRGTGDAGPGLGMDPRHERSRPFRAIGLDVIRTCKLAASYDVIKVYGPRRLQLRMSSCLAQPRALPPKGVGRRGVSACFTLQRSVAPSLTSYLSYLPSTPISLLDAVHLMELGGEVRSAKRG